MDHKTLSDLIGLIYDVAFDLTLWPRLVQALAEELAPVMAEEPQVPSLTSQTSVTGEDAGGSCGSGDYAFPRYANPSKVKTAHPAQEPHAAGQSLVELLRSHCMRALELNRRSCEGQMRQHSLQTMLEHLPLGILIVDRDCRVIACNRKMEGPTAEDKGFCIRDNILSALSSADTVRLRDAVRKAADNLNLETQAIHFACPDTGMPLSVLIKPLTSGDCSNQQSMNHVCVLAASGEMHPVIPTETLKTLYQLTAAEAKLVSSLAQGNSLDAIAPEFGVSKHTLRNQLKSVYEKTGTHRQAELIRQVVTGPAMLASLCKNGNATIHSGLNGAGSHQKTGADARCHQTMILPDGRRLGYAEYGLADGRPVMLMHAANGSRLERHPDETIIERCGIRLIIPDRPGVGLSDKRKPMTLFSWAQDASCLADHLGLGKFNVIGYSQGGAFALACAHWLRDRVGRLVLAAGVAPFERLSELEGVYLPYRLMLWCGRYAHTLVEPLIRLIGLPVAPELYFKEIWRNLPPVDKSLISDIAIKDRVMESARENLRQGHHFILQEILQVSRHWGFELDQIAMPVEMWHGELDRMVPPQMARKMAGAIPNCRAHFLRGAGHFLLFHCWKEILLSSVRQDP